jgi:hypothetical protein
LIDEIFNIANKMMNGGMPAPGRVGSLPGVADMMTSAASKTGGSAAGINNIRGGAR